MIAARQVESFSDIEKALLRSVLYFDIFNFPITAEEACTFAPAAVNGSCEYILESLVTEKMLFRHGKFYSAQNRPELVQRRIKGNLLAEKRMKEARKYSRLIAAFPFVRAVLLSGSISKGFMDHESDIDYFVITEPKRVWIVRSALAIFRRVFLFNSHRNLCTNYFIDSDNLCILDKNIFTATELCTLKPMYGQAVLEQFRESNSWASQFLPQGKFVTANLEDREFRVKKMIEQLFSLNALDRLNEWLMKKTVAFWRKKYSPTVASSDFEIAFRSREGVSKSHPRFFQKRALNTLDDKIRSFEAQHEIDLTL